MTGLYITTANSQGSKSEIFLTNTSNHHRPPSINEMFAYSISLLLLPFLTSVLCDKPHVALKFGDDLTSYIMISPDMSPLEEKVSICSWVKQVTSHYGGWIHYRTVEQAHEILLSNNLGWAYLVSSNTPHSQTPVQSQWYHVCLTWAYSSGKNTLYHDGVQIGTATTPSGRKFSVATGSIVLGQYHNTHKMEASFSTSGHSFGGEMTKLNILKRELTAQEVAEMYKSGICSTYEESLKDDIHLSWETLLSDETEKHGNVEKLSLTCPDHTHSQPPTAKPTTAKPTTAKPTAAEPTEQSEEGCNNRWAVLRLPDFYNQVRKRGDKVLKSIFLTSFLFFNYQQQKYDDSFKVRYYINLIIIVA